MKLRGKKGQAGKEAFCFLSPHPVSLAQPGGHSLSPHGRFSLHLLWVPMGAVPELAE